MLLRRNAVAEGDHGRMARLRCPVSLVAYLQPTPAIPRTGPRARHRAGDRAARLGDKASSGGNGFVFRGYVGTVRDEPTAPTEARAAATADAAFGADMYQVLAENAADMVFSPASVAGALRMALCGARGCLQCVNCARVLLSLQRHVLKQHVFLQS